VVIGVLLAVDERLLPGSVTVSPTDDDEIRVEVEAGKEGAAFYLSRFAAGQLADQLEEAAKS
jgi:hypothetical protein